MFYLPAVDSAELRPGRILMQAVLTVEDRRSFSGDPAHTLTLLFSSEQITVRDLIRTRVHEEVAAFERRRGVDPNSLVQPVWATPGLKVAASRQIDVEAQCERAFAAFQENGFLLLVDERQVTELDEVIAIRPQTKVTFFKLVPLVGG